MPASHLDHAAALLSYFTHQAEQQPADPEMRMGAVLTQRWMDVMRSDSVSPAEVALLLDELMRNPDPGSGWYDLWLHVAGWAADSGYAVPAARNPWAR